MGNSVYNDIRATLESHLAGVVGLPDIFYENVNSDPIVGQAFLKVQLFPTRRRPACRGSSPQQRYQGVFTVYCYTPEGIGPSQADDLADLVIEAFDATTDITHPMLTDTIISIEYAEREQGITSQPYYYVPVNVGFYHYAT